MIHKVSHFKKKNIFTPFILFQRLQNLPQKRQVKNKLGSIDPTRRGAILFTRRFPPGARSPEALHCACAGTAQFVLHHINHFLIEFMNV